MKYACEAERRIRWALWVAKPCPATLPLRAPPSAKLPNWVPALTGFSSAMTCPDKRRGKSHCDILPLYVDLALDIRKRDLFYSLRICESLLTPILVSWLLYDTSRLGELSSSL